MMIDWPHIESRYNHIFEELLDLEPLNQWHITPKTLKPTNHKTKYGMADINGVVYINEAFVGTQANDLLEATIRHELAHLCVGIHHGHDHIFKACAKLFKAAFGKHLSADTKALNQSIGYKYKLFATLQNDQVILFRKVHRRHSKYTKYKPKLFSYLTISGQKVLSFHYESD